MKRSFEDSNNNNNNSNNPHQTKKLRDNHKEDSENEMNVLYFIHSLVQNIEQGNIDHCLSNPIESNPILSQLNQKDADLLQKLDSDLRKIAQRQLQLETENLRCRIMIQQQHQLFTSHDHEDPKSTITSQQGTPEDELTSIHDASLLEKLESSHRETIPESYFGNQKKKKKIHCRCNALNMSCTHPTSIIASTHFSSRSTTLVPSSTRPPFHISSATNAYPVYFSHPISTFPAATFETSPDNIVCPECVIQAVQIASSVFDGELSHRITCQHTRCTSTHFESNAPINTLKNAVNAMLDRLQIIADEVNYVAHETAVRGKLGVQARCGKEMKGLWLDFVVNLNKMTRNHLEQVRDIADVSTAIAKGDLSKAMTVPVKGETLLLKNTFNTMGKDA